MKKRIFAGALALLMIIGLLPVSSMVKKPMEGKAEQKEYSFNPENGKSYVSENKVGTDGFFKIVGSPDPVKVDKSNSGSTDPVYKIGSNSVGIKFTIPKEATAEVSITWTSSNAKGTIRIINSETSEEIAAQTVTTIKTMQTNTFNVNTAGTYEILRKSNTLYVSEIKVKVTTAATTPSYKVSVVDSESTETISPKDVNEGETFEYTAVGTGDVYWINSNGILVSTTAKLSIPVYYSDTYTAVYGKTGNKVTYYTPYGGELATYYADDNFTVPEVPTRYGYKATGWDKDIDSVKEALKSGNVEVRPVYDNDTSLTYSITVDTSAIDGATPKAENVEVNKEVKASVTSDDFAYWSDENGNVLSYNSTYYFLANRNVTVKAVKKSDSGVEKTGVVTYIGYESKTIIFEYTVPDTYTMKFAGVLASTNKANVESATVDNRPAGVYKLGADEAKCSSYKTFRYTLKNNGTDTWYARPVLTYSDDSGVEHTIVGTTVYEMN